MLTLFSQDVRCLSNWLSHPASPSAALCVRVRTRVCIIFQVFYLFGCSCKCHLFSHYMLQLVVIVKYGGHWCLHINSEAGYTTEFPYSWYSCFSPFFRVQRGYVPVFWQQCWFHFSNLHVSFPTKAHGWTLGPQPVIYWKTVVAPVCRTWLEEVVHWGMPLMGTLGPCPPAFFLVTMM